MCSFICVSFSLIIRCSFSIALSALILLWTLELRKCAQLPTTNTNCFQRLPHFFSSLNVLLVAFIFSSICHLLINAWPSKLIWPIITSLCVPYIPTWKHLTSSLWMNVTNFIFRLLHIHNLLTLFVHYLLILPIYLLTMRTHLVTILISLLTLSTIMMIMQILLMTKWILLLI
jgi:hypothetical protein